MSSFRAEIKIDDQVFALSRAYFEIHRSTDSRGRPTSMPTWSTWINMETTDKTTFAKWMADPKMNLDVAITFYQTDQDTKYREIKLQKATCYLFHEQFASDENFGLLRVQIMGPSVDISSSSYNHDY
jgi:hypothetical protein